MNATETPSVFVPHSAVVADGIQWLSFDMNDGTYDEYKSWPKTMTYGTKTMVKSSWNSDTHIVVYKQHLGLVAVDNSKN